MNRRLAACSIALLALGAGAARAEVRSLTIGVSTTCPYGLVA
jgi:hypothetical protein